MLRNHGLLTVGRTIRDAFINMVFFENTCRIQIDAQSGGCDLNLIGPGPIAANANIAKMATAGQGSMLAWRGLRCCASSIVRTRDTRVERNVSVRRLPVPERGVADPG